jgi:membrane protein required for colicin V production
MFGIEVAIEGIAGFIMIFLGALLVISVAAHLLRAVFRFAGLGVADILLGILFSVAKLGLIVSVLFSWFASVNKNYDWVSKQTVEESRWFKPISEVTDKLTPYFNELTENFLD